jgi:hypothetical protein
MVDVYPLLCLEESFPIPNLRLLSSTYHLPFFVTLIVFGS